MWARMCLYAHACGQKNALHAHACGQKNASPHTRGHGMGVFNQAASLGEGGRGLWWCLVGTEPDLRRVRRGEWAREPRFSPSGSFLPCRSPSGPWLSCWVPSWSPAGFWPREQPLAPPVGRVCRDPRAQPRGSKKPFQTQMHWITFWSCCCRKTSAFSSSISDKTNCTQLCCPGSFIFSTLNVFSV